MITLKLYKKNTFFNYWVYIGIWWILSTLWLFNNIWQNIVE